MIGFGIACWALLLATYVVLAGQIGETEIVAAIPASLIAAWFTLAHRRNARRSFAVPGGLLPFVVHCVVQIVPDTCRVGWALLRVTFAGARASQGSVGEQPFRIGTPAPRDAARRAIATLGVSLAPNGYVLRVSAADGNLLIHRLVPARISHDHEWPS